MSITHKNGDVLTSKAKYVAHQVNCLGIMGGGLALQIRNAYPAVYTAYRTMCGEADQQRSLLMGKAQFCQATKKRTVVNLFGQYSIGSGKVFTEYEELRKAMESMKNQVISENNTKVTIAMPELIGCGLAGGDPKLVSKIIKDLFENEPKILVELWQF